jgi:hypothetical protein
VSNDLAIIVGDPHLSERIWTNRRTLTGDAFYSFWQAVEIAKAKHLPMVLLGDIFDTKNVSSAVLNFFCRCMDDMRAHELQVFYVQGNHDYMVPPWPAVHDWPEHINETAITLGEGANRRSCYGLDWSALPQYVGKLANIPVGTHVLFTHQAWSDFGKMGSSDAATSSMLPCGIYVMTGDLHENVCEYERPSASGGYVSLYSPGPTCMQAINESSEHAVYTMVATNSLRYVDVVKHTLITRNVDSYVCTTQAEFDAAVLDIATTQRDIRQPMSPYDITDRIVRITYPIDISADSYARLQAAAVRSGVHLFTNPQVVETAASVINVEDVHTETMSTLGDAVQLLTGETEEARGLATRMLSECGSDVYEFLTQFQKQYMQETA